MFHVLIESVTGFSYVPTTMFDEQAVTTHHEPYFRPAAADRSQQDREEHTRNVAAAASEAAEREMALARALSPPRVAQVEPPQLRQPVLPDGFDAAAIDEAIFERGVAFSRQKVLAFGKEQFQELLARDHDVRSYQRVLFGDITAWSRVAGSFASINALRSNVPPRKIKEQLSGQGADRELAGKINGWQDLWKVSHQELQSVCNLYAFHDVFTRLIFGQSLLERIGNDGRVRSRLFCRGEIKRGPYFADWLSTLEGQHFIVTLVNPLFSILAWLTGETAPPPQDLALDWLGKHAPTPTETKRVEAVVEGFLLGLDSWALWNHVGQRTRRAVDHGVLQTWQKELAGRYAAISRFHEHLRGFFWKPVGADGYRQFDADSYRAYLNHQTQKLLGALSLLTAAAIDGVVVARFQDWLLVQGPKPKSIPTAERIECKLSAAFPGSRFNINVEPV